VEAMGRPDLPGLAAPRDLWALPGGRDLRDGPGHLEQWALTERLDLPVEADRLESKALPEVRVLSVRQDLLDQPDPRAHLDQLAHQVLLGLRDQLARLETPASRAPMDFREPLDQPDLQVVLERPVCRAVTDLRGQADCPDLMVGPERLEGPGQTDLSDSQGPQDSMVLLVVLE